MRCVSRGFTAMICSPPNITVESPWIGAMLRLEPYLQACFVWFGLAHFWAMARNGSPFEAERLESRLATTRKGFQKAPVPARISTHLPQIDGRLLKLVEEMQDEGD